MAKISDKRLKEMEAEMNRFEEEILSTKQTDEPTNDFHDNNDFHDIDERQLNNQMMIAQPMIPPGIRLGPRPDTNGPRMIIHSNTYFQPQIHINENQNRMPNSFDLKPPPPPPTMLTSPEPRFNVPPRPSIDQNLCPPPPTFFIPPQLRYRSNLPMQRPFYPMGPPRPYNMTPGMTGSQNVIGPQHPQSNGPGIGQSPGQMNGPDFAPKPSGHDEAKDTSSFDGFFDDPKPISGPKIIYSAPPVKRKIEPSNEAIEILAKNASNKKAKLDKKDKKEKSTDCDSALIPMLCVHG